MGQETDITKGLIEYLKQDAATLKQMAHDNKTSNEVLKITMQNLESTLLEIKDFIKTAKDGFVSMKDFDENKVLKEKEHMAIWERIKRLETGFIGTAGFLLSTFIGLLVWYIFQK